MRKQLGILLLAILVGPGALAVHPGYVPPEGFVPDAATAVPIARAVLARIYGAEQIKAEEPLVAIREGDVWLVNGTLHCPKDGPGDVCLGGVAELRLSAVDGRILHVIHTK